MANCNHNNINCGCKDSYLITPPPCPTPEDCPERQPCSEVFDAACIIYTGPDLECGEDVIVTQNSSVAIALEDVIGYFCNLVSQVPVTVVEAGDGIEVTSATVGTTTTYTVSYTGVKKYTETLILTPMLVVPITHNLNSTFVTIQLIDDVTNALLVHGTDYVVDTYSVNSLNVSRTDAGGLTRIIIIG